MHVQSVSTADLERPRPRPASPGPRGGDEENLLFASSVERVEELLGRFYGQYPWPWPASTFTYLEDPELEATFLNQDIGDWSHSRVGVEPMVWVAGCGVNQALATALRFPGGRVIGSDLSETSLSLCNAHARQIGVTNLELRHESINRATYDAQFDYIACTGVIHHNAEPSVALTRIAKALKPGGVLELMVYNRFHRIATSAFQKGIRALAGTSASANFEEELALARAAIECLPLRDVLEKAFTQYMDYAESDLADLLINPNEHSYTVESLAALADECGLELIGPCHSPYAKHLANAWTLPLPEALMRRYEALPDLVRWQVTNLLLQEKSPLLWFYMQRRDGGPRPTQQEIAGTFLDTTFTPTDTTQWTVVRDRDGRYRRTEGSQPFPSGEPTGYAARILPAAARGVPMREAFRQQHVPMTPAIVDAVRIGLTTSAFPYLQALA